MYEFDGVTHVNIYSKSKTKLGRSLSHFSNFSFEINNMKFENFEGYYFYILLKEYFKKFDYKVPKYFTTFLQTYQGSEIRKTVLEFIKINKIKQNELIKIKNSEIFKSQIIQGLKERLKQNKILLQMLKENDLPFKHYYVYGDKIIDKNDGFEYIIEFYNKVSKKLKKDLK